MDFLDRLSEVIPDRVKAIIPDSINLSDVPPPLRPLAVMADTLLDQAGLPNIITAEPPARKPKPAASAPARPETVIKPATPRVEEPSIGGFIREQATGFVQDRIAGKPLPINITSILTPGMMALDQAGLGQPLRNGAFDLLAGTVETGLIAVDTANQARNDIRNWAAPYVGRGLDAMGANPVLRDVVVTVIEAPASVTRDRGLAAPTAQFLEDMRRLGARWTGDGQTAIYSGAGWSYQGKEGGLTSMFLRQADGRTMLLNPGQAEYWQHAVPYLTPMAVSMLYGGGEVRGVGAAFNAAGTADAAGGVAVIGGQIGHSIILKPEAYRTLVNLANDPSILNNPRDVVDVMNTVFAEYAWNKGSFAGPVYIPSLGYQDDPYHMLHQLSLGGVQAYQRATPFESFDGKPKLQYEISDLRHNLLYNASFKLAVDKLAMRSLAGEDLAPAELAVLRFGLNILTEDTFSLDPRHLGAAERAETNQALRMAHGENIAQARAQARAVAEGGTDDDVMLAVDRAAEEFRATGGKSVPDAVIVKELQSHIAAEEVRIEQERKAMMERLQRESIDISIQPKL